MMNGMKSSVNNKTLIKENTRLCRVFFAERSHLILFQIDGIVFSDLDSVALKAAFLFLDTAVSEICGEAACRVHHLIAGVFHGIGIVVENVPHHPREFSVSQMLRYLPVGHHFPAGDGGEVVIYLLFHQNLCLPE